LNPGGEPDGTVRNFLEPPTQFRPWKPVTIDSVFFDLGGVLLRTEHQAPREHLAERLHLSYEDLMKMVFESDSARQTSLGRITTDQHWQFVASRLGRPASEIASIRDEFFGGDVLDLELLGYIRSLRPLHRTGLISNGWPDVRDYIIRNKFDDAFDTITISAEVGVLKPDPEIYALALRQLDTEAHRCVLVDDTPKNVEAAIALGMAGVIFRDPYQMRLDLQAMLQ
jgi:FMN phosphatase YigB (HAD superfamily)